jgi:uncharacterized protein
MAVNPLSPGVYIDEISVFPPSVAPVATAVPAFIGYTEKGPTLTPFRITSMLDYETVFGGAFAEDFGNGVQLNDAAPQIVVNPTNVDLSPYNMHYNLRMYFANGGGPCYIVSVDTYTNNAGSPSHTDLINGINATEKADEVTLLVVPEAVVFDPIADAAKIAAIHSTQLDLCNKMKDRFAMMDVITTVPAGVGTILSDATKFRNDHVGLNNLKYGATYYPALETLLTRFYNDSDIVIDDTRSGGTFDTLTLTDVLNGVASSGTITVTAALADTNSIEVNGITFEAQTTVPVQSNTADPFIFLKGATIAAGAANLAAAINNHAVTSLSVKATAGATTVSLKALVAGTAGNSIPFGNGTATKFTPTASVFLANGVNPDKLLYNAITAQLLTNTMTLYPSSSMAGIYASVDRDRGVWKAPANVSLNGVVAPSVNVSAQDQENLNVDATSGKSINVIRAFTGRGILAWGARTLAGNDNEWRYINVRRLFIYAEESIMKATEFVVFEPNDSNTWSRVRSLITNFLTNLWRDGGLVGSTPAQAFFVKVGLGETMTAQDILEGKLIIQIGLAASRPAEFIVLQFSHKLQEG